MRFLVVLVLVAVATAFPRKPKPTKEFPKKYDASLDGLKDTYEHYQSVPSQSLEVPAENAPLDTLVAPSSYDPQNPIHDTKGSSYTEVKEAADGDDLVPPPADTYSVHDGSGHSDLVAPPAVAQIPQESSYLSYQEGEGQASLAVPSLSSYAETPSDKSGADVLASLASMVQALPQTDSYSSYDRTITHQEASNAPSVMLLPPSAEEIPQPKHSSYSEDSQDSPSLTPEQVIMIEDSLAPLPAYDLIPPSL